jgi:hypothetical protein
MAHAFLRSASANAWNVGTSVSMATADARVVDDDRRRYERFVALLRRELPSTAVVDTGGDGGLTGTPSGGGARMLNCYSLTVAHAPGENLALYYESASRQQRAQAVTYQLGTDADTLWLWHQHALRSVVYRLTTQRPGLLTSLLAALCALVCAVTVGVYWWLCADDNGGTHAECFAHGALPLLVRGVSSLLTRASTATALLQ